MLNLYEPIFYVMHKFLIRWVISEKQYEIFIWFYI
jgi:hypothetical protein